MTRYLILTLLVSLAINMAMFIVAFRYKTDKLTDISYAVTFLTLGLYGFITGGGDKLSALILAMVGVWSIRLGGFLLLRIWKKGKDARFDKMRDKFFSFGRFWLLQAITVWVVMLGATLALQSSQTDRKISVTVLVGLVIWLLGLVIESIADATKYRFSNQASNKGKWIEEGIWRYSRHPNYFGEILVWLGMFIVVLPVLDGRETLIASASPIFITVLLLFVSGIPLLEKSADKKWGNLKAYQDYKKRTSVLIPLPNKKLR